LRVSRHVIAFATALASMAGACSASAENCNALCQAQTADQAALLATFNALPSTAEGRALLDANLAKENDIYLNSTQADKIASGTILILPAVPANVLLRAFPDNPNYYYNAQGMPTAPALPGSIEAMAAAIILNEQIVPMKYSFGAVNVYGNYYGFLPGQTDSAGNPPPYQVSAQILSHPFTIANSSLLAWQNQQMPGAYNVNWVLGDSGVGDFPSAHTILASSNAIPFAILAPGYYQQLVYSVANFSYDLNVFAVHWPLDVIGGRILSTYVIAKMLAGDPLYASSVFNSDPGTLSTLSSAMQTYFGGGGSSPYAAACIADLVACLKSGQIPTAATYTQQAQAYLQFLTYGLPSVGDTTLAPVVPAEAHYLIATRYPYLNTAQLNEILYTTELPSGVPLDDGSGWARINLFAAGGGYGAFRSNVTVNMDASLGGLNAFDVWSNNISGPGGLTLTGTGTLVLAGTNTYTGGTHVQSGKLGLTGSMLGPLWIASGASFVVGNTGVFTGTVTNDGSFFNSGVVIGDFGGTGGFTSSGFLGGNGTFGSLDLLAGAAIAPGHSVGTIHVTGNLGVAAGTTYQAQVEGNTADKIEVGGTATLAGGTVLASLIGYSPVLGHAYPILSSGGVLSGRFDDVTVDDLPFIQPSLSYDSNNAFLTLTRNATAFASVAGSANQIAVGNALDAGPAASGLGLAITTQHAAGARQAFESLSGEAHASAQTTLLNDSLMVREALTGRLRQASFADGAGAAAALGSGGPALAYAPAAGASLPPSVASALALAGSGQPPAPVTTFWTQALGSWGRLGSDGNAAGASTSLAGFFSGVDQRVGPGWLAGIAGGYTNSFLNVRDRGSSANIDTAHLAGYAAANAGAWTLRGAAAASFSTLSSNRSIGFPGFVDTAHANYGATTAQIFGELGYGLAIGKIAAEPFGGLAYVHLHRAGFAESGGLAALGAANADSDIGYSTLGGRIAADFVQPNGMMLTPRLSVSWQHALGAVGSDTTLAFQSTAAPFTVAGAPLTRDAALIESGFDLRLSPLARLGLAYSAQLGHLNERHSVQGHLSWQF